MTWCGLLFNIKKSITDIHQRRYFIFLTNQLFKKELQNVSWRYNKLDSCSYYFEISNMKIFISIKN